MQPPLAIPPKRYSLLAFFVLAFGISWAFWVPAALDSRSLITFPVSSTFPLAAFGPTLAALILTTILARIIHERPRRTAKELAINVGPDVPRPDAAAPSSSAP